METIALNSVQQASLPFYFEKDISELFISKRKKENSDSFIEAEPVFFSGRYPFKVRIMVVTRFVAPSGFNESENGTFITYVGYKKEHETDYDFDEMLPSLTADEARKTHARATAFFGNSSLFILSFQP